MRIPVTFRISLLAGVLTMMATAGFSDIIATKTKGAPSDYTVPDAATVQAMSGALKTQQGDGTLNAAALMRLNPHGAVVSDTSGSLPAPKEAVSAPPSLVAVPSDQVVNGFQTVVVYGTFSGDHLALQCGQHLIPAQPQTSAVSASEIDLKLPENLLDRNCTLTDSLTNASASFVLPGHTCDTDASLCPGDSVGSFDTTTSDGQSVHIDIRNGTAPKFVFTAAQVTQIENYLATVPPDHLRNVTFIQASTSDTNYFGYTPFIDSGGLAANNGGIIVNLYSDLLNDVANGIGSQLFNSLAPAQQGEFNFPSFNYLNTPLQPEDAFDLSYSDWYKDQHYGLFSLLDDPAAFPTSPQLSATDVSLALSMASLFYSSTGGGHIISYVSDQFRNSDIRSGHVLGKYDHH